MGGHPRRPRTRFERATDAEEEKGRSSDFEVKWYATMRQDPNA